MRKLSDIQFSEYLQAERSEVDKHVLDTLILAHHTYGMQESFKMFLFKGMVSYSQFQGPLKSSHVTIYKWMGKRLFSVERHALETIIKYSPIFKSQIIKVFDERMNRCN